MLAQGWAVLQPLHCRLACQRAVVTQLRKRIMESGKALQNSYTMCGGIHLHTRHLHAPSSTDAFITMSAAPRDSHTAAVWHCNCMTCGMRQQQRKCSTLLNVATQHVLIACARSGTQHRQIDHVTHVR
jgi:hypothetical protein